MHLSKNIITLILAEIMEILYEYEANYGHYLKSVFFCSPSCSVAVCMLSYDPPLTDSMIHRAAQMLFDHS